MGPGHKYTPGQYLGHRVGGGDQRYQVKKKKPAVLLIIPCDLYDDFLAAVLRPEAAKDKGAWAMEGRLRASGAHGLQRVKEEGMGVGMDVDAKLPAVCAGAKEDDDTVSVRLATPTPPRLRGELPTQGHGQGQGQGQGRGGPRVKEEVDAEAQAPSPLGLRASLLRLDAKLPWEKDEEEGAGGAKKAWGRGLSSFSKKRGKKGEKKRKRTHSMFDEVEARDSDEVSRRADPGVGVANEERGC
jgi:hypothetical protein